MNKKPSSISLLLSVAVGFLVQPLLAMDRPLSSYAKHSDFADEHLVFQYDLEQSQAFWHAARNKDFAEMKRLAAAYPRLSFNVQMQYKDDYVSTTLDAAMISPGHVISEKNQAMIQWLVDNDAWSFAVFHGPDFRDLYQAYKKLSTKYDGSMTYKYWHKAEINSLEGMKELLATANGKISVNLIRAGNTPLDFAVYHKREDMAQHLLPLGAKLCCYTPEQFKAAFPNLWKLTPVGKTEKDSQVLSDALAKEEKLDAQQERSVSPVEDFKTKWETSCIESDGYRCALDKSRIELCAAQNELELSRSQVENYKNAFEKSKIVLEFTKKQLLGEMCKSCKLKPRSVVYMPCKHRVHCSDCANKFADDIVSIELLCPLVTCGKVIHSRFDTDDN